jgi:hypothetical protein
MQVSINLDGVVEPMSGLKGRKLGICHHHATDYANYFAFFKWLARKHSIATNAGLSKFNSRISPGLWRIRLHFSHFFFYSGS